MVREKGELKDLAGRMAPTFSTTGFTPGFFYVIETSKKYFMFE
jgi:hypothetical protein